ncbi:MAG TPA: hypothetical protein VG148_06180 [Pyrinomonadaceae bacterium]|nr:hypothetical protein [Pyrinomonadaceae bacterium]
MPETRHFINDGYGWACKRCRAAGDADAPSADTPLPRFFREGEAEDRNPRLSSPSLARWKDAARRALVCPRCGIEERVG